MTDESGRPSAPPSPEDGGDAASLPGSTGKGDDRSVTGTRPNPDRAVTGTRPNPDRKVTANPGNDARAGVSPPSAGPRGADLARAALDAARARTAAARAAGAGRRGGAGGRGASGQGLPGQRGGTVAGRISRRRWSGPGPDAARDPQRLGDTVTAWLARTGAAGHVARAAVFARWAEIVGPGIADHAVPVSLVDGELVLQAESTAWATQLRMMAASIAKRINGEIGRGTVTRIRAKGPAGPSWRFGNRHVSGRGPRDTYG